MTPAVSSSVESVPSPMTVHDGTKKSFSTSVEYTGLLLPKKVNSILSSNLSVQCQVQNMNDVGKTKKLFEFDSDEDSEIRYLTRTDSVQEVGKKAI